MGISFADGSIFRGCKILLTSREGDVCLHYNCKHPVKITTLTFNEARDLFRNTVGFCQIAEYLAQSAINAQAYHFPFMRLVKHCNSWKDALGQLENGKVENIAGIDPHVYACVKLSTNRLPDDAKSCLFWCSLYPEDAVIHIKKLIQLEYVLWLTSSDHLLCCSTLKIIKIKAHDLVKDEARFVSGTDS